MELAVSPQAAPPGAGATWRQVLDPHLHFSATHGSAAGPDTCSAATARALWGAAAGAAGAAAAAAAAGHAAPTTQGSAGPPLGSGRGCVTEQELAARASQLLTAVKQVGECGNRPSAAPPYARLLCSSSRWRSRNLVRVHVRYR